MRKIKLPVQEITKELIIDLINEHYSERNRILKLKRYFNNENEIVNRNYIDKNNHTIDAIRYALENDMIKSEQFNRTKYGI